MDDDDEFGDLYTDVLRPITAAAAAAAPFTSAAATSTTNPSPDLNLQSDDEDILYGAPDPKFTFSSNPTHQTLVIEPPKVQEERVVDERTSPVTPNLIGDKDAGEEVARVSVKVDETGVLESGNVEEVRVSEKSEIGEVKVEGGVNNSVLEEKGGSFMGEEVGEGLEIGDLDSEPMIPGLSSGPFRALDGGNNEEDSMRRPDSGGDGGGDGDGDGGGDDWDSDSEDDLQIVLNDKSGPMGMGGNGGMGSDDEDGEDLVIVADGDQPHQPMEEQEWGEDMTQVPDGERKEAGDAAKVNGGVVNAVGARIGYSSHGYHPNHHSQFKYVRPGAAVVPGGAIAGPGGPPGQVRPLVSMGPMAGRGRGDWRPVGVKPGPGMQRPFHSGFGLPVWPNSAGRGFGSGLDFTLPSHKTVFDIDIDSFEEKPWRHPGVDVSDFFNFGLDEENWKDYCKQLEQLRLEATMQSKIRVYESGRSEQDYDPDLPPELAAAAGMHDAPVENTQLGNTDGGQPDLMGQGRGAARVRPPIPTGRAIQVEGGFGERLPSIDTRPPRMRDCDSVIEIVLQGATDDEDDPITGNDDVDQPDNDLQRDVKEGGTEEETGQIEYEDRFPQTYDGRKRDVVGKREPFTVSAHNDIHEGDGILPFPPEAPAQYSSGSKGRAPSYRGGTFGTPQERWPRGTSHDRYTHPTSENDNDVITCQNVQVDEVHDNHREKSRGSSDGEQNPETSSVAAVEAATEPSVEQTADVSNELELADSTALVEEKDKATDVRIPTETVGGGSPLLSSKKQKLNSRVEQPAVQDIGSGDDLRATRSSDNSRARSGSSRDNPKRRDGGEEEVIQEGRSRRVGDMKRRHDEDERSFQRKDDFNRDGRQEMNRNRMFVKGREDSHLSYPYRERDLSSAHLLRAKPGDIERSRERDNSIGARLRRDDDTHGKRAKDEDTRKRERVEEMGSRHRSKTRESEKSEKDDHFHSRKRLENGDWRGHHDKDVGPRQRERDDVLMNRHENFDDAHSKRRKDEEHLRREQAEKEILHGYRAREDTSRRKRERDDSLEQRRREDQARVREKPDDNHSVRHREENWRQRERDDRRLKQPYEDMQSTREREGRGAVRTVRDPEDKSWVGSTRAKDESKGLGSDKEYPFKDKRRQTEHSKRSDRAEDDSFSQHRGRDSVYARENQFVYEDRNPRHERSSIHNDRSLPASDGQLLHKERHKDNRRNKELDGVDQDTLGSSKRKSEDHRSEKVSMKVPSDQVSGRVPTSGPANIRDPAQSRLSSSASLSKRNLRENDVLQQRHSSRKHREDAPSDDEQHDSRRGRSKLERWTSHKDRDDNMKALSTSASKAKETSRNNTDPSILASEQPNESMIVESVDGQHPTGEDRNAYDSDIKDADRELTPGSRQAEADKVGDERHLDTVAKLKKRSERFKTPMPPEKDVPTNKKMDNEALASTQSETAADAEVVKPERPARKRRWISS